MKCLVTNLLFSLFTAQALYAFDGRDLKDNIVVQPPNWNVQIYPNPSNGVCNLTVAGTNNELNVLVFNVIGEKVFETRVTSQQKARLDLTSLDAGLYIVQVMDEATTEVRTMRLQLK